MINLVGVHHVSDLAPNFLLIDPLKNSYHWRCFLAGNAQLSMPIGLNWISGEKQGFEVGVDVVPVIGSLSNSYLAPHAGYRAELGRKFLLRVTAVGWWFIDGDVLVVPGVSLGARL